MYAILSFVLRLNIFGGETILDFRSDRKLSCQFSRFRFPFNLFKLRIKRLLLTTWHELHALPFSLVCSIPFESLVLRSIWDTAGRIVGAAKLIRFTFTALERWVAWEIEPRANALFTENNIMNKKCDFSHFLLVARVFFALAQVQHSIFSSFFFFVVKLKMFFNRSGAFNTEAIKFENNLTNDVCSSFVRTNWT